MSTPATGVQEWRDIDWTTVEKDVHGLQRRIYRASQQEDTKSYTGTVTMRYTGR